MLQQIKLSTVVIFIFAVLAFNCFLFSEFMMPLHWLLTGAVALIICITGIFSFSQKWAHIDRRDFIKRITRLSLVTNLISIGFVYLICYTYDGTFFEPRAADS